MLLRKQAGVVWLPTLGAALVIALQGCSGADGGEGSTLPGNGGAGGQTPPDSSLTDSSLIFELPDSSGSLSDGAKADRGGTNRPIDALAIDPVASTLVVAGTAAQTQQFHALGSIAGGSPALVPATFTIDNSAPGTIDASTGLFTTNNTAGGVVTVTASYGGKTATAQLTVVLKGEQQSGTVPLNASSLFDPANQKIVTTDAAHTPTLVYPVPETLFPQNVYRVLFQWRAGG